MDYKGKIEASIQAHLDAYMDIVKTLYDNPETGFEEYETQKVLVKYLKDAGFDVKPSVVLIQILWLNINQVKKDQRLPICVNMMHYQKLDMDVVIT